MLNATPKMYRSTLSSGEIRQFQAALLGWFAQHKRDLPWRRTRDPYAIWISEIMLQQTRVMAVIPYYERFLQRFPDFYELAGAPEADLLAHWAGLGYYHRARNLQKAAQAMREMGAFPTSFAAIRLLPGIGDYTGAAVASIAFELPHASVDGNVLRVLSRVYADPTDIGSMAGKRHFGELAEALLARDSPGDFNQAMMELGATLCVSKRPQCLVCPVAQLCRARQTGKQHEFPVKLGRAKSVTEERVLFWIERKGEVLLWQRAAGSRLMAGFWELPERGQLPDVKAGTRRGAFRHGITFHNYRFEVYEAEAPEDVGACQWIALDQLEDKPVSTVLRKAQRVLQKVMAARQPPSTKIRLD